MMLFLHVLERFPRWESAFLPSFLLAMSGQAFDAGPNCVCAIAPTVGGILSRMGTDGILDRQE